MRLGPLVHRRCVDQRSPLARDHDLAIVRGRARVQRGDRAVQSHAEGAVRVSPSLREPGAGAGDHCGVHRALQSGVAHRAARPPHTRPGPGRRDAEGRMIADRSQPASHIGLRRHDLGATPIAVSPRTRARDSAHECSRNRVRYTTPPSGEIIQERLQRVPGAQGLRGLTRRARPASSPAANAPFCADVASPGAEPVGGSNRRLEDRRHRRPRRAMLRYQPVDKGSPLDTCTPPAGIRAHLRGRRSVRVPAELLK